MVSLTATAPTDAEARLLASSMQQAFIAIRTGRSVRLQPPIENFQDTLGPSELYLLEQTLDRSAIGSPETVRRTLEDFVGKTGADEVMIITITGDCAARRRSYELLAREFALDALKRPQTRDTFEYGYRVGIVQGYEAAINVLLQLLKEEKDSDPDL